ncbi:MAG TPA: flagellin [bacterium]|nr:flagellin [bacterium]
MVLRINHNIAAINSARQLVQNGTALRKSLEHLSSGMRINRAADGPAALIISEQMRSQIAGLNQAVDNAETGVTMVQTTEAAMTEVTNLLTTIRQLAVHAANEGANDQNMLEADQLELNNALNSIDRISTNAQFGVKKLLDGSTGANGVGIGEGVEFIAASPETKASPIQGYDVRVTQLGSRAHIEGTTALTQEMIDKGEEFTIAEGGKTVSFTSKKGETVRQAVGLLKNEISKSGLNVDLTLNQDNTLSIVHRDYGSDHGFSVSSSTAGVLSKESRTMEGAVAGKDIVGTIGGEAAIGKGQVLTGVEGTKVEGLSVRYSGNKVSDPGDDDPSTAAGRVAVFQNSLVFQVGANVGQTVAVSLVNVNTRVLGRGVRNDSGYTSLRDADLRTAQGAIDTQRLVDRALNEVTTSRARLGAFQKNSLEANLRQLRVNVEELTNAESVIRDTDMAKAVAEYTRNKIMFESATAMLAQANQIPRTVLDLLH